MYCRYRTLADAVGLLSHVESSVDGVSLMPVVMNPNTAHPPRMSAQTQFPRCYSSLSPEVRGGKNNSSVSPEKLPELDRTDCQDIERDQFDLMGYSLRTPDYRITEWRMWDGAKLEGRWDVPPNATELYDHSGTSGDVMATELVNIVDDPAIGSQLARLRMMLRQKFTQTV